MHMGVEVEDVLLRRLIDEMMGGGGGGIQFNYVGGGTELRNSCFSCVACTQLEICDWVNGR